jgi:hypothetical protein
MKNEAGESVVARSTLEFSANNAARACCSPKLKIPTRADTTVGLAITGKKEPNNLLSIKDSAWRYIYH